MRAIVRETYGPPDVLDLVEVPLPTLPGWSGSTHTTLCTTVRSPDISGYACSCCRRSSTLVSHG